ncbi:hypothetical protein [Candidatus Puniceispirillum marinum]|uniref:Uncharacterized protein n=1 Tax=Puniceispirillum marinum (strain IMCC1322) TaxID=488538 RepID=D5BU41_PUNMI|nr:hypothetical protein [Candidatus Puniceispirillum marinum]ADE39788.1 hypothetical protein SAR116_1545 [Candidatus Puniceispirillum marinum IMCC1322]
MADREDDFTEHLLDQFASYFILTMVAFYIVKGLRDHKLKSDAATTSAVNL